MLLRGLGSLLCRTSAFEVGSQASITHVSMLGNLRQACTASSFKKEARSASGAACSTSYASNQGFSSVANPQPPLTLPQPTPTVSFTNRQPTSSRKLSDTAEPAYFIGLHNLRDNPGARQQKIRVGRGDGARRGNYCGRGMKGQKARNNKPHSLFDGGQLGLLKFPITRQRPPYEVLYNQLGVTRLQDYVKLGLLDNTRIITMKDLYDVGCVPKEIEYGVMLYGQASTQFTIPVHIQVTACTDEARAAIEAAGGSVTRVYYTAEGLKGLLKPEIYTSKRLPLPLPAHSWHPKHNDKFDAIGQLPPSLSLPAPKANNIPAID